MNTTTALRPSLVAVHPDIQQVLDAIRACGGRPLLVGGCVRDAILDPMTAPADIDIEVHGHIDIDVLVSALGKLGTVNAVGRAFGVLKVRIGGQDLDIAFPRRDSKVATGHRGFSVEVDAGIGMSEAAGRRDFTINALMWDPQTGEVIDPWGGLQDLAAGVLRHTTAAFTDDPLRVLRGVQFAARFGFSFAPETAALARSLVTSYHEFPTERVWGEWAKVARKGVRISAALEALRVSAWLAHYPPLAALYGVEQDPAWHPEGDVATHTGLAADQAARLADEAGLQGDDRLVVVLATLCHDLGKVEHSQVGHYADGRVRITSYGHAEGGVAPTQAFLTSIGCPLDLVARIIPLVAEHMASANPASPAAVRRLARRLAPATMREWALVTAADRKGRGNADAANPAEAWLEMALAQGVDNHPARPLLRGDHLIAAGLQPGPAFGPILAAAATAQEDGAFSDTQGAIAWLDQHAVAS